MNLAELIEILNEFGIQNADDLRKRLSDDFRSTTAFHEGHQQGFKYAHTMQATMDQCLRTQRDMADFQAKFDNTMKLLRSVKKELAGKKG